MSLRPKKILILSICLLPLILSLSYEISNVNANSSGIKGHAMSSTPINWPDWLNWTIRQDVNLDGKVDIYDCIIFADAFNSKPGDLKWNVLADINNDGSVDIYDAISIATHFGFVGTTPSPTTLTVSSTTSLYETGVEDQMKAAFQTKYPWITLNFLSQGTGIALQTAQRGDADMVMVHSPSQEQTFMTGGYGVNRKIIASNFFIIVGPQNDPANATNMSPLDAMKQIKTLGEQGRAIWVSRGDGSGTNTKEKSLWAAAGINWTQIRTETSWYKETGQGMTATLLIANELGGYTLSDTASYLTNTHAGNIQMKIMVQAQKDLLNVYSVIADNPLNANLTQTKFAASMLFIQWLVTSDGQNLLANYGTATFGAPIFTPFVPIVALESNSTLLGWIQNYAYFNGTECPATYRYDSNILYAYPWDS